MFHFFSEVQGFKLQDKTATRQWLEAVTKNENCEIEDINYIFCGDEYLLQLNRKYLQHDTFTDIITFENNEPGDAILADIFISVERVRENANQFQVDFQEEMDRVLVHGLLHLCGYKDKTSEEREVMRKKEDAYLSLRRF